MLKPFHESIVDAILHAHNEDQLDCLGLLIVATKIPKNHDAIAIAYQEALNRLRISDSISVVNSLFKQKRNAETERQEAVDDNVKLIRALGKIGK